MSQQQESADDGEERAAPRYGIVICYPALPEAKWLRDLAGIRDDLEQVRGYLGLLNEQVEQNRHDFWLWDALSSAIAIAYGRCFNKGVRAPLPASVFDMAHDDIRQTHEYLLMLRNKHIAHSVNAYESNTLEVRLAYYRKPLHIEEVDVKTMRFVPISGQELSSIAQLVNWLSARVDGDFQQEKARVKQLLAAVDVEDLAAQRTDPSPDWFDPVLLKRQRQS